MNSEEIFNNIKNNTRTTVTKEFDPQEVLKSIGLDKTQDIDKNVADQKIEPQYVDVDKPKFVQPERRSYFVAGNANNNEINTTAQRPNEIEYEADVVDDEKKKDNYFGLSKLATNKKDIVKNVLKYVVQAPNLIQNAANTIGMFTGKSGEDVALEGVRGFAGSTVDFASAMTRFFGQNYMYFKGMKDKLIDEAANIGSVLTGGEDFSDDIKQKYTDFYNRIDRQTQEFKDKTERFLQYTGIGKTDKDGFIYDLVGVGASLLYAIGATVVTKSPAAAAEVFGAYQYQSLYEEGIEKGFSPIKARTIGVIGGAAEGALELVGLHVLIETLAARKSFAKILKSAATEFIQEASQQGAEEILATTSGMRTESVSEILANVGYAGLIGALIGGGSAAISNTRFVQKMISDSATKELINIGVKDEYAKQMVNNMLNFSVSPQVADELNSMLKDEQSPVTYKNADPRETYKEFGDTVKKALDPAQKRGVELELIQANKKLTQELANVLLNSGKAQNGDDAYRRAEQVTAMYDMLAREAYNQEGIRPEDYYKRFHVNTQSGNIEIDERNVDEDNPFVDVSFDPVDFDEQARAEYEAAMDAEQDYMDQVEKENKTTLKKEARILGDMGIGAIRRPTPDGVGKDRWGEYKDLSPRIKNYFFSDDPTAMSWDDAQKLLETSSSSIKDLFAYLAAVDDRAVTLNQPGVFSKVLAKEKEDIKQKAVADGTFLKAPNGKDSNLPEQLWLTVRTKAFKNWFGDWLNDPQNASKVVDENGEPKVCYHGTKADFSIFEGQRIANTSEGAGFYFTPNKNLAQGFGNVKAVFLNIRNPQYAYGNIDLVSDTYEEDYEKENKEAIDKGLQEVKKKLEKKGYKFYKQVQKDLFDIIGTQTQEVLDGLLYLRNFVENENFDEEKIYNDIREAEKEVFKIDGYTTNRYGGDQKVYVAFTSNQIKSINNRGSFDRRNPDIYYQAAYHGTPHRFDTFSTEKIGTGEGHQAHGWGLYFAGQREEADKYRKGLLPLLRLPEFVDNVFSLGDKWYEKDEDDNKYYLHENNKRTEINKKEFDKQKKKAKDIFDKDIQKRIEEYKKSGQLYKADIPENDVLLDEDKTFNEQPKKVQEALLKMDKEENLNLFSQYTEKDILNKIKELSKNKIDEKLTKKLIQDFVDGTPDYFENYDKFLTENLNNEEDVNLILRLTISLHHNEDLTGREIYKEISDKEKNNGGWYGDKGASLLLNKYGVKGISYFSMQDGQAYVIFDDKTVKVLEKFYQADKNYYERQSRNVELKNKDNREKLLKNGGTEEQADEIENLGALRHKIHSTDVNSLATGDNEDVRKLDDGSINSILEDADLPTLTTSESPLYTTQDTDDIIADYLDKSIDDLTASDKEQFNSEVVEMWAKWKEKVNNQIEKYLEDIDKKYKTQYKPTGKLRERFQQDNEQEQPRGSITSFDRQYWIDLFSGSDKSTLLHEGSHGFLSEVLYFAKGKNPSPKILAIKKQLDNWLGEPEDNGRYSKRQQELFAGSSEVYFMEGKAPTPKLKTVFERFKKWLTDIYDAIRNDLPKINDDVRELFDTILSRSYDVPDSNIYAGKESAIKEVIKNIQEGRASEVDGITIDDVYNLLNVAYTRKPNRPSKNLKQLLNDKNIYDFNELNKAGADTVLQILKDGGYVKEDATAETAMDLARKALDGEPVYRLVDQWRVAGDIDFARNLRVLEKVIEFSQIDSTLEKILELQQEGYRNVEQGDVEQVQNDYKRLFSADVKEAKKIVEDIINRLHKKRFIDRAAQKQMIVDLNFSSTVEEIKESVLNVIEDLQDEIKLVKEQLRNPRKPIVRKDKTIPPGKNATEEEKNNYKKYMRRQINKLLKQALPRKQNQQKFSKFDAQTQRFFNEIIKINKMSMQESEEVLFGNGVESILAAQNDKTDIETDKEGIGFDKFKKIKNMFLNYKSKTITQNSCELLKELYDNLQSINIAGRTEKEIEDFLKRDELAEDTKELIANVNKYKPKTKINPKKLYLYSLANWYSAVNAVAGKEQADKDSVELEEEAVFTKAFLKTENIVKKSLDVLGLKHRSQFTNKVNDYLNEKYTFIKNYSENGEQYSTPVTINKMELICAYIWSKNKNLKERIIYTYGNEQFNEMMAKLDKQDTAWGDVIQEVTASMYDDINKVYIKMYGLDMGQEENYFPSKAGFPRNNVDLLADGIAQSIQPGFIKSRTVSNLPIPRFENPINIAFNHLVAAQRFVNLQLKLAKLTKKYTKSEKLRDDLTQIYGKDNKVIDVFDTMLKYLRLPQFSQRADIINNYYNRFFNSYVITRIAAKPSIMIKQLLSFTNYAVDVDFNSWIKHFFKQFKNAKQVKKWMFDNIPYLRARYEKGAQNEALEKAIEGEGFLLLKIQSFKGALSFFTRCGDLGAIIYGGYPMIQAQLEKGVPLQTAIDNFVKSTLRSQQANFTSTLSNWQNHFKKDPFLRTLSAYTNTPFQYFRKIVDISYQLAHGDITGKQAVKGLFNYAIVQSLLYNSFTSLAILSGLLYGDWDDAKDDVWLSLLQISNFMAIPILNNIIQMVAYKALDQKYTHKGIPIVDDYELVINKIFKGLKDGGDFSFEDYLVITDKVVSSLTGIPVQTLYTELISSTKDLLDGEYGKFAVKLYGATESRANKIFDN